MHRLENSFLRFEITYFRNSNHYYNSLMVYCGQLFEKFSLKKLIDSTHTTVSGQYIQVLRMKLQ